MTDEAPTPPWVLIPLGAILTIPGLLVFAYPDTAPPPIVGTALLALGATITAVGVVGVGVLIGLRRADWLRNRT